LRPYRDRCGPWCSLAIPHPPTAREHIYNEPGLKHSLARARSHPFEVVSLRIATYGGLVVLRSTPRALVRLNLDMIFAGPTNVARCDLGHLKYDADS